jgi:hypothetical protein
MSDASPASTPSNALPAPPEGIFRSFDDLLASVQRWAKEHGYGIVKLRASNYRDGKPTRYDLVCDRGGVKYNSTAKKRSPSTRKIDCPWRAKAVCEVQLGNQWRFAIQDSRHNHEARPPPQPQGAGGETGPMNQTLRSINNKLDRLTHEIVQLNTVQIASRLENLEKEVGDIRNIFASYEARFQNMEQRMQTLEPQDGLQLGGIDDVDVDHRILAGSL